MAVAGKIVVELKVDESGMVTGISNAGGHLKQFQGTLNQTSASVEKLGHSADGIGTKFRHLVTTLGALRFVAMDINDVFLRLPAAIMKTAGELERTQALLGGMSTEITKSGRAIEAASNFNYITRMAKQTPFDIAALSDSFVKFKSAGLDPTKGSMQALTDSVAKFGGNGETLKRASVAIQQMMGKSVVSMEELRQQLGEAVPTAMRDMATGAGLSMAELTKLISKGTVDAADAINKMLVVMELNNSGAAEEMMKTWVGIQAQLKTNLQLAAKDVADAGFGDAMKKVANEINFAMGGVQFKQLTNSVGEGLGEAVVTLSKFAKFLMDHSELIKSATVAFVAYKVAASAVSPALLSVKKVIGEVGASYAADTAKKALYANAAKAASMEVVAAAAAEANARRATTASNIVAMESELAFRRAMAAQARAESISLSTAIDTGRMPKGQPGAGRMVNPIDVAEQVNGIERVRRTHQAAARQIEGELKKTKEAHAQAAIEVMGHGNQLDKLATSATASSKAMTALGAAGKGVGLVLGALGGWTLALNVAIAAGIWIWSNWGKAAEEAIARAKRAQKGLGDENDLAEYTKGGAQLQAKIAAARKSLDWMKEMGYETAANPQMRASFKAGQDKLNELNGEYAQNVRLRTMTLVAVEKEAARSQTDATLSRVNEEIAQARGAVTRKTAAAKEALDTELKNADGNAAKIRAANQKHREATIALAKEMQSSQIAVLDRNIASEQAKFNLGGASGAAAVAAVQALEEKRKSAQDSLKMALDADKPLKLHEEKKEGSGQARPDRLKDMLNDLREKNAALDAEVAGLESLDHRKNKVAAMIALTNAKFKNGDYYKEVANEDGKGTHRVPAKEDFLKELQALETHRIMTEEAARALQTGIDKINELGPKYEDAMKILSNPTGEKLNGKVETSVDKFIANIRKHSPEAEAHLAKLGESFDSLRSKALIADLTPDFQKMAQESKTIAGSMTADHREAAKARAAADNEAHRAWMQNRVDEVMATNKVAGAQMQAILDSNTRSRAAKLEKDFETPMQRLASEWNNTTKNMEEATARWASSTVDAIADTVSTGKLEWRSLATSILKDMLKMQVQKGMGSVIQDGMNWLGNTAGKALGFGGGGQMGPQIDPMLLAARNAETAASTAVTTSLTTLSTQAMAMATQNATIEAEKLAQFSASTLALTDMTASIFQAATSLKGLAASAMSASGSNSAGGLLSILGLGSSMPGMGGSAIASGDLLATIPGAVFADGGIMTNMGPVPLRKYAAGGIARSPQLALYGEAGPEAYVPLPDGRSIPVTMQGAIAGGGQQNNVTIQINVDGGGKDQGTKATGNSSDEWMGLANKIRGVVRDELVSNQRPGGLLYK